MAFLLPFIPFILEGAAELGVIATEATGLEVAGSVVKGAVTAAAGSAAGAAVDYGARKIIGSENVDKIEKGIDNIKSEVADVASHSYYLSGYTGVSVRGGTKDPRAKKITDVVSPPPTNTEPQKIEPLSEDQAILISDTVTKYGPAIGNVLSGNRISDVIKTASRYSDLMTDVLTNEQVRTNLEEIKPKPPNATKISYDLGTLLGGLQNEVMKNPQTNDERLFKVLEEEYPALSYLLKPVYNSTTGATKPSNDKYNSIASVYNGKNLNFSKFRTYNDSKGNTIFEITDEVGAIKRWSTAYNTYKVIPTIWGNWTGINSRNDLPPVSLLDLFATLHDIDYHDMGSFHEEADYKLISRISQNMDAFSLIERPYAKVALQYFTNAGHLVRYFVDTEGEAQSHNIQIEPDKLPELIANKDIDKNEVLRGFYDAQSTTSSIQTIQSVVLQNKIGSLMIELL